MKIRKNDEVMVIAGKDKGKTGKVKSVLAAQNKVIVERINMVKKHRKPSQANPSGGIDDVEMPLDASNVMLLDGKTNKPTRVRISTGKDGAKVRVSVKSDTVFD
ncbi:MAG: 50S ribosomal protein L24 [Deltaproteobacteria bacterium]|nr:50S ribosomal protein L24 [Deltaproteobacteria bacterium]MBN2673238.1 50S ribosomal protein L24 [Deltaproteobacteria bacterium]